MPKHQHPPSHCRKTLARVLLITFLCSLFYLLGSFTLSKPISQTLISTTPNCPEFNLSTLKTSPIFLDFETHHKLPDPSNSSTHLLPFKFCPQNYTHYSPCHDLNREILFSMEQKYFRERHCPTASTQVFRCLIPWPEGYRTPFAWPKSREFVRFSNVPFKTLSVSKAKQNWVRFEGDVFSFPGGGTSFSVGVKGYVDEIGRSVPLKTGEIRTVLDVGCGVASFGAYLVDFNILTMSIAPRDIHEAQVQFALERGVPAMLGILSTHRLPYSSSSFDMAHCSRCLVPWNHYDGLYLMEIDRVLRPGGYWILSGPPINWSTSHKGSPSQSHDLEEEQAGIEDIAKRLCWKKISEKGQIAVWRKPTNHVHCIQKLKLLKSPHFCESIDPDAAWYKKMEACITRLPKAKGVKKIAGGALSKWPKRLTKPPPRIISGRLKGVTVDIFNNDMQLWNRRVSHYKYFFSLLPTGKYRNIMDMNAGFGGFAAALSRYPVWVMNVVPSDAKDNTLGVIYERGLIGTYMDWCEAFSTYPRTYDLIHANGVFTMYMDKCDIIDILLEMDRILRPKGSVIIRDNVDVIVKVKGVADRMRWQSHIAHTERGPLNPEKLLVVDNSLKVIDATQIITS